jgi:hypothetical protein
MLIATFGPTTAWQGTRITWENGAFLLEGHGSVAAADVMEYDRQGHLVWADEGTRAWVGSRAAAGSASAPTTEPKAGVKRMLFVAIIALLVLNLVLLVVAGHLVHVLP